MIFNGRFITSSVDRLKLLLRAESSVDTVLLTYREEPKQPSRHYTGALGPTQTAGWVPPAGLTNTSSSSNLVFLGGLPYRYWPGSA